MGVWAWAREAVERRPLARLGRPHGALRWPALRHAAHDLWRRPAPPTDHLRRSDKTAQPSPAWDDDLLKEPQSSLGELPSPRPSSTQAASRSYVLSLLLGEPSPCLALAGLSSPSETPSEAGEAELPPHLAFDSHTPVAVLNYTGQDSARVGFHNASGRRLKLNLQWGPVRDEGNDDVWERTDRFKLLEQIKTTLSRTELEPGESGELVVESNFGRDGEEGIRHGRPGAFQDPLVVEIHSDGGGAEWRLAEVELLFLRTPNPADLRARHWGFFLLPFSPRAVISLRLRSPTWKWLRLEEQRRGLLRSLHPERHFLVPSYEDEDHLALPVRFSRVIRLDDLDAYFRYEDAEKPMLRNYAERLGSWVAADAGDVAAVRGAVGREERQRLVRELATAAFQRPSLPEEPRGTFFAQLDLRYAHTLTVYPPHDLLLIEPPELAYLLLGNSSACPIVWAAVLPAGCPVELAESEGVLTSGSFGHLGLSLLPRPDAPDCETLVTLAFRYAYAPAEEHGDAALPERLADFLDQEELTVGSVARLGVDLVLPPPFSDHRTASSVSLP